MTSILDHERSKTTDDQRYRTSNVVNLKNLKNRKVNNDYSVSDVLNGDSESPELEPVPIALTKKTLPGNTVNSKKEKHLDEFLNEVDPEQNREGSPRTKQDAEQVRGFVRGSQRDPASYGIDTKEEIPDNPGTMEDSMTFPQTTLAFISWTAPDKHHELISHAWRKGIIAILVVMAFAALLWQGSILTAITFFALAMVTSMHFWREVRHEKYEIYPHGIAIAGQFHHYHDLDSFWIHEHPDGFHELSLCTGRLLNYYIKIPLKGQDPFEVRDALMRYLPEERHEEGLEDLLRRKLGL